MGNSKSKRKSKNNRLIKNALAKAEAEDAKRYHLVLLGTGVSGKSTIFQQLRKIYEGVQGEDIFGSVENCASIIRQNMVEMVNVILRQLCYVLYF